MSSYEIKDIKSKEIWENFVLSKDPKSFLHSWNWGEANLLVGKKIFRIGIYKKSKLVGVCLVIHEKAKRGPHFLIPAGPIINWVDKTQVRFLFSYLSALAKKERVWFIRIRPEIIEEKNVLKGFRKMGLIPAPMHLHAETTWVININRSEEEILSNMRKTTRYMVKKGLKAGFSLEKTLNTTKTKVLSSLQKDTVARHKFVGFSDKLFEVQLDTFGKDNQGELFICRMKEKVMTAAIIIYYGDSAYYHHSASSDESRDTPASYYMQWEIIKEAKRRGKKFYNMWGIAKTDDPNHRFAGVTLFKKGFGGERLDWLHAHDLPISIKYWITYVFETVRRLRRHL